MLKWVRTVLSANWTYFHNISTNGMLWQNNEADTYAMICRFFALDSDRRFPIRFRQVQFSSLAFSFSLCFTKNFASGFNSASLCLLFNANEEKKATRRRTSDKQSRSNLQCRVVALCSLSQSILPVRGDHCVGDRTNIADFAKMSHFVSLVRYVVKLQIT